MTRVTGNMEKQIEKLLNEAIELADLGEAGISSRSIGERIYDSEPELMEQLKPFWMVDRLVWLISRKRRARKRLQRGNAQLVLPGFYGLPQAIFLPDGQRKPLDDANVTQVREHIKMLRARLKPNSRIQLMEAVLKLMQRYSPQHPRITWGEVKKLEFESRTAE